MELQRYNPQNFDTLNSWIPDEAALLLFSGTEIRYPLTAEALHKHMEKNFSRDYFIAMENDTMAAFAEIIPQNSGIPRLGRIILDPSLRRQGLGSKFIGNMEQKCVELFSCKAVELFVIHDNLPAIACYLKLGYQFLPEEDVYLYIDSEHVRVRKMRHDL